MSHNFVARNVARTRVVHSASHVHGGHHFSHRRHYWHGRWWAYGVGSCWVYDDDYGEYYWGCGDDDLD